MNTSRNALARVLRAREYGRVKKSPTSPLRFRLLLDNGQTLGPGTVDLLDAILANGSIAAAGRVVGMSYKRAWQLVDELNNSFAAPLVHTKKGGDHSRGATLTATGRSVLAAYRAIEMKAGFYAAAELRKLEKLAVKRAVQ